ncbi:MAG: asparagine synthase (glutamine-hydrolyzing), partial [Victivallales bacterium]|nr:asparagine synthase (glutamine-hydrolyzing) [Victivallales bacterium]
MCGITGISNHHGTGEAEAVIHAMNDSLRHRGPDDDGFFIDQNVALGHRRLAVISPETGHQPIFNEDETVVAILNGEIYNHLELRHELQQKGHRFTTESDTETLVHLYEEFGDSFVSQLQGMFAFAVYDSRRRRLLLARDRLGQKPLFYFIANDTLVFASELSGLLVHPAMEKKLDIAAISDYLSLLYVPEPQTIYRHVHRLPPACTMTFSIDAPQPVIQPYWQLDFSQKAAHINFQDASAQLRTLVENAVRKRMIADVPLGVFLSGGLDSAIIAAVAAQIRAPEACDAYTIGFADALYDERAAARATAAVISRLPNVNLHHHELEVAPADFDLLCKLIRHFGQPFADASMLPTFLLSQFTRTGLTVAL